MTVEETILLSPDELEHPSPELVASLPTIIDVLEYMARRENAAHIKDKDGFFGSRPGGFIETADKPFSHDTKLIPQSFSTFTLMRGENSYHKEGKASLYRKNMTDEKRLVERIKTAEFMRVLETHPLIQVRALGKVKIEPIAIAQHYGFRTEYMDVTNNKWVAAFFATCKWNKGDRYEPVKDGHENGIGILYVSQPNILTTFSEDIMPLGYQYFARPSKQYTWMYKMSEKGNFDQNPNFMRIVFRHDAAASQLVYEQSGRQQRYYPVDYVSEAARTIQSDDYAVSWASVDYARRQHLTDETDDSVKQALANQGVKYHEAADPIAHLDRAAVEQSVAAWLAEEAKELVLKTLMPPLVYPM